MASLRTHDTTASLALQFAILTAARTGEAIGATWGEIDEAAKVWTIPAVRMKAKREHRVPLSGAALDVLAKARAMAARISPNASVFLGRDGKGSLSGMALAMLLRRMNDAPAGSPPPWVDRDGREVVPHGFRSTFRDWCSEATSFDRDTAEAALAHTVKDKVEAAYRRGDQMEKRRRLMEAWAEHCARIAPEGANVVAIRTAGA